MNKLHKIVKICKIFHSLVIQQLKVPVMSSCETIEYRHSSIYAAHVGTQKITWKQKPRQSRFLSSTKGEKNR